MEQKNEEMAEVIIIQKYDKRIKEPGKRNNKMSRIISSQNFKDQKCREKEKD